MSGMRGFAEAGGQEFAVGSVFGVRWWSFNYSLTYPYSDLHLESYGAIPLSGARDGWEAGVNTADCKAGLHPYSPAPDPACGCGFWAYWELTEAPPGPRDVVGVVEGFGRATIGEKGFRCGKARIVALHLKATHGRSEQWQCDIEDLLSAYYGVRVYASLDAMLGAHPTTRDYAPLAARQIAEERAARMRAASASLAAVLDGTADCVEVARHLAAAASAAGMSADEFMRAMQVNQAQITAAYGAVSNITTETITASQIAAGTIVSNPANQVTWSWDYLTRRYKKD